MSSASARRCGAAFLAAPAALYLGTLARYARDVPRGDDYWPILRFLCDWTAATSWADRWHLFLAPFWDNRVPVPKAAALLEFWMMGHCNFLAFQAAGWIAWAALAAALAAAVPAVRRSPWLALPAVLVLMQPEGGGTLSQALGALSCVAVLLFALGALAWAEAPGRGRFAAAVACSVLAPSALINGLVLFPVAVVRLGFLRRWRRAAVFAAAGVAYWAAYFFGYGYPLARFSLPACVTHACVMAGSLAAFGRMPLAVVGAVGAVLGAVAGLLLFNRRAWRTAPTACAYLAFLLLSIAACARGRIDRGPAYMIQDRYRLYSVLTLAVIFLIVLELLPEARRRAWTLLGTAAGLGLAAVSYAMTLPDLATACLWSRATAIDHQLGTEFPVVDTNGWAEAAEGLRRAESLGIYRLPRPLGPAEVAFLSRLAPPEGGGGPLFRAEANGGVSGYLLGTDAAGGAPPATDFAALRSASGWIVLPRQVLRAPAGEIPRRRSIYSDGTFYILPQSVAEPGRHALCGIEPQAGGSWRVAWTGTAEVPPASATPLP